MANTAIKKNLEKNESDKVPLINKHYGSLFEQLPQAHIIVNNKGQILTANPAAAKMLGRDIADLLNGKYDLPADIHTQSSLEINHPQGGKQVFQLTVTEIVWGEEKAQLITLQESKSHKQQQLNYFYSLLENSPLAIIIIEKTPQGKTIMANQAAEKLLDRKISRSIENGLPMAEYFNAYKRGTDEFYPAEKMPINLALQGIALTVDNIEIKKHDGSRILLEATAIPLRNSIGQITAGMAVLQDITKRNQNEEELRQHRKQLQKMVLDRTEELERTNQLLEEEIVERRHYEKALLSEQKLFTGGPVVVFRWRIHKQPNFEYVSPNIIQFGYTPEDFLSGKLVFNDIKHPEDLDKTQQIKQKAFDEKRNSYERDYRLICANGEVRWVYDYTNINRDENGEVESLDWYLLDITERKRAATLQQVLYIISRAANTETSLTALFSLIHAVISELIPANNFYIALIDSKTNSYYFPYYIDEKDSSPSSPEEKYSLSSKHGLTGYLINEGKPLLLNREEIESLQKRKGIKVIGTISEEWLGAPLVKMDGEVIGAVALQTYDKKNHFREKDKEMLSFVCTQISMAIANKTAEETLKKSEEKYKTLTDQLPIGIYRIDNKEKLIHANPALAKILEYDSVEDILENIDIPSCFVNPEKRNKQFRESLYYIDNFSTDMRLYTKTGKIVWVRDKGLVIKDENNQVLHIDGTIEDITKRKQAEENVERQLKRLAAMREIDASIAFSIDLRLNLKILLDQVITQLHVNAADVMLLNPHKQVLECAADRGFRTDGIKNVRLNLADGCAGAAAHSRQMVVIPDLSETPFAIKNASWMEPEGFVSYYGMPLLAKGEVKGVLEVFHRSPLHPGQEWLDFLSALAGQAAVLIDNATLFEDLESANARLILAYDATIEGWARALELRDQETEGHSQRVSDLTLRLAQKMNIPDDQMVHIRRGALLHDIGKMSIPDGILLKQGPLTDEEWEIMKQHPVYAGNFLSNIDFLKPAMIIPYYHHEKWDGSGYPTGVKGEQIPLAARLFAVADVWDALCSDRPYRDAWPEEKAIEYIRNESGKHFDPRVVEAFLQIINE